MNELPGETPALARANPQGRGVSRYFALLAIFLSLGYVAYPYLSLYALYDGVRKADQDAIELHIDWPTYRESIRSELSAIVLSAGAPPRDGGDAMATALMTLVAPKLIDAAVEAYVTPRGLTMLAKRGDLLKEREMETFEGAARRVRWAFFATPTVFRVEFGDPGTERDAWFGSSFVLKDWVWKLSTVRLPKNVEKRLSPVAAPGTPETAPGKEGTEIEQSLKGILTPTPKRESRALPKAGYSDKERQDMQRLIDGTKR